MKYRKKPVVIEATQWFKMGDHPMVYEVMGNAERINGWIAMTPTGCYEIKTLEGRMTVSEGDWIITGVKGEHYPCKPDIFEMTYEKVEAVKGEARFENTVITQPHLVRELKPWPVVPDDVEPVSDIWQVIGSVMVGFVLVVLFAICLALFFTGLWVWSLLI